MRVSPARPLKFSPNFADSSFISMFALPQPALTARGRRRLQQAHEDGFLDATCCDNAAIVKAHGLWCWRLKIPMVWVERRSRYSRYGRIHLDMFTTPNLLNSSGRAAMQALGAAKVSAHDAHWDLVPRGNLAAIGRATLRAALRTGNCAMNRGQPLGIDIHPRRPLQLVTRKAASA